MTETPLPTAPGTQDGARAPLLEIAHLTMRFGGIVALDDVNFSVSDGRIVGLIGPNGAGKTTLFNCLSRLYRPERGTISLNGAPVRHRRQGHRPHLPKPGAVRLHVGARQRQGRRPRARP